MPINYLTKNICFICFYPFNFASWRNSTQTPHIKDTCQIVALCGTCAQIWQTMREVLDTWCFSRGVFLFKRSLSSNHSLLEKWELPWKQAVVWQWPSSVDNQSGGGRRWRNLVYAVSPSKRCDAECCCEPCSKGAVEGGEFLAVTHGGCGGEPVCIHNSLRLTQGASVMLGWVSLGGGGISQC